VQARLLDWFAVHKRDLPWRRDRDPYRVWISEAMLQQTRVETVLPYYARFMARFPTLAALSESPIEDVLAAWSGLGYYRRARTLHAAARTIVARHGGQFPREHAELLSLPGIGPYTAGAVASIAFEAREPLVDGNVARVFCRWFALAGEPSSLSSELWSRARELMPAHGACGDWNQALMELGARICTPRDPHCGECPLRTDCRALAQDRVSELPWPKARPEMIPVELHVMAVVEGERWLFEQRPSSGRMAEMWQLPTLEVADSETAARAVEHGRLHPTAWPAGVDIYVGARIGEVRHTITNHRIRAIVHEAERAGGVPSSTHESFRTASDSSDALSESADSPRFAWFDRRAAERLPLTGLARKVLRARFLAILAAPANQRRTTSPRRSPSNPIAND
jgi:A/G-specific adenine glycosylase